MIEIIEPKAVIWKDMPLLEQIERAGRICYRSEDKIETGSAEKFIKKVLNAGHNSVLEMGAQTFSVTGISQNEITNFISRDRRYLEISATPNQVVLTASPRAIIEFVRENPETLVDACLAKLIEVYLVFESSVTRKLRTDCRVESPMYLNAWDHKFVMVQFTISRAISHQLVRHRRNGVLQESQRYCDYKDEPIKMVKPIGINESSFYDWRTAVMSSVIYYKNLRAAGNPPQVARSVLPNATATEVLIFANLRQWKHILDLRCSGGADPAMKEVMVPLREQFKDRGWI
jgi:thymidylate synthase (FAD)